MRPAARPSLPTRPRDWLRRQANVLVADPAIDVKTRWRDRRQTMNRNGVVEALRKMAGWRARCMFCGDSEGCDIEHYRPKSVASFRTNVFDWTNLLWLCQPCNRRKGNRFPLSLGQAALLLDPASDRTWDYFDFVPFTGYLVARVDLTADRRSRADATLQEELTRLNDQIVLEERRRAGRHLRRATERYLTLPPRNVSLAV